MALTKPAGPVKQEAPLGLAPFGRKLQPRVPEIAETITSRIWKEIPGYSALGETEKSRVRQAAHRNVEAYLAALSSGKELTHAEIEELGFIGGERADQGIPLEDVMRAFRMTGRVLWEYLGAQLAVIPDSSMDVMVQLGSSLMRFTDHLASSVAQRYSEALGAIVRRQEATRREFLQDLILGGQSPDDSVIQRARGFGYDVAGNQFALAAINTGHGADQGRDEAALTRAMNAISESVGARGVSIVGSRGAQTIALFSTSFTTPLVPGSKAPAPAPSLKPQEAGDLVIGELGEDWRIGVGGPYPALEGCRRSYLEAREALETGLIVDPGRRVYPFEEYLLYLFLRADKVLAERFVRTVLGPVVDHDRKRRSDLIKSLEAYFVNGESAKETGRRLYAHPHTITYRIKQIERLTGRSLRDPQDKLHLQLAVKALRILQPARGGGIKGSAK